MKCTYITIAILALAGILLPSVFEGDKSPEELKPLYTDSTSGFVTIDGMHVHYRREGQGEPVVLLHGTSASLHTWNGWIEALSDTFTVIRMDLPGFGLTGPHPDGNYSVESYVGFLHTFLDSLAVRKFHLGGNSLGGEIAWRYAVEYPEQVHSLILIDAAGYPHHEEEPFVFSLAQTKILSGLIRYVDPEFLVKSSLEEVYGDDSKITESLIRRYTDLTLRKGNRDAFIRRVRYAGEKTPGKVGRISQPTLIMWGEFDAWIPVEDAYKFATDIEHSTLKIYEGVGHVPMEEISQATAKDARSFLLEHQIVPGNDILGNGYAGKNLSGATTIFFEVFI